jgi:hypothetical protein
MRIPLFAFLISTAACGADDLLLPGDPNDGVPVELRALSGDGQTAVAGDPVRHPLVVQALDHKGRPVPGAIIVFEFVDPPAGAEIAPPNTETDSAGRASAAVKLGTPVGDQPVEARLADPASDLSVQFLLTALQPNNGGGGDDDGDGEGGGGGGGGGDGKGNGGNGGDGGDGGDDGDDGDDEGNGGGGNGGGGEGGGDDDDEDNDDDDDNDDNKGKGNNNGKGNGKGKGNS